MDFKLNFEPAPSALKLVHSDSIVSIGSCFSEEMSNKLAGVCFRVFENPFGTLFHPDALLNVLEASIFDSENVDSVQRDDLFFSWDSSSKIYAKSEQELRTIILQRRKETKKSLSDAKLLIVTFGTAWKYAHKQLNRTVGNCHKEQVSNFTKELASIESMQNSWTSLLQDLKIQFPNLQVLFSVSPVRHKKDGLIENNQSKARLIELVHSLVKQNNHCHYFPAYEIVIDELRDYRFYAEDLVHPNSLAINYIWEAFKKSYFDADTQELTNRILQIKATLQHKSLHPNSVANSQRIDKARASRDRLLQDNPSLNWLDA